MSDDSSHTDTLNQAAQGQIRSIVERLERLEQEKAEVAAQIKEVLAEAKGNGLSPTMLRKAVRLRKIDRAKRQEDEAILDLYMSALGELPLFERAKPSAPERSTEVVATPDQLAVAERMVRGVPQDQALYDQAVALVRRDGKASVSYIQRCLQIGFNRASSLIERMEAEGIVGRSNSAGYRDILADAPASPEEVVA